MVRVPHVVIPRDAMPSSRLDAYAGHATGLSRVPLMDGQGASVHIGYHVCELAPGGEVDRCVHAYEKACYVLAGELTLERDGDLICLGPDTFALVSPGVPCALANRGDVTTRWVEVAAPQPKMPGGWIDTFFTDKGLWSTARPVGEPKDPRTRHVGRNDRRMPPGAFMHGDLQGFSIKRFIDREFGAALFTMFSVEFANGGICNHHDHPFEEAYLILEGSVPVEFDGRRYTLGVGDFAWTGVGSRHAFFPVEGQPVRWLEMQAPQPPTQFGMRWHSRWEHLARLTGSQQ